MSNQIVELNNSDSQELMLLKLNRNFRVLASMMSGKTQSEEVTEKPTTSSEALINEIMELMEDKFLSLEGGEMSGGIYLPGNSVYGDSAQIVTKSNVGFDSGLGVMVDDVRGGLFGIGSGGSNMGIYDRNLGRWAFRVNSNGDVYLGGDTYAIRNGSEFVKAIGLTTSTADCTLESGWSATTFQVRKFGNVVWLNCYVLGPSASKTYSEWIKVGTIPSGYRPSKEMRIAIKGANHYSGAVKIETNGSVYVGYLTNGTSYYSGTNNHYFNACYVI